MVRRSKIRTSKVGYLHRCFEKAEAATHTQVFPHTDRLNYVSPLLNNVGFALAVEKLIGIVDQLPLSRPNTSASSSASFPHHRPPDVSWRVGDGSRWFTPFCG